MLDDVLGLVGIAQHAPGEVVQASGVALDEAREGRAVPALGGEHVPAILQRSVHGQPGYSPYHPRMPALIVHAGAWDVPPAERPAHREGVDRAVRAGWDVLRGGGSAVEAVTLAVRTLEDDDAVNAGTGSVLCREGWVELDAALMEGRDLRVGAVACLRDVANPILVAGALLGEDEVFLVGEGAAAFAAAHGIPRCDPATLVVERERRRLAAWVESRSGPADTVGAVALDGTGCIAAGSSTGGRPGQPSGRVGDAPVPGCGFYADQRVAGVACTGWGEDILRTGLARRAFELARTHAPQDACWLAIRELEGRIRGRGGLVMLTPDGGVGYAFNTGSMPVAWIDGDVGEPVHGGITA